MKSTHDNALTCSECCNVNSSMEQFFCDAWRLEVTHSQSPRSERYTSCPSSKPPSKVLKTGNWSSCIVDDSRSKVVPYISWEPSTYHASLYSINPVTITKAKEEMDFSVLNATWRNYDTMINQRKRARTGEMLVSHNREHVMAERKRREKLSERFIALAALIPGLKKVDKVSVLGDAIKYLRQLQEKLKVLEDQVSSKSAVSSTLSKKSQLFGNGNYSSSCDLSVDGRQCGESLPQIEAKVCQKTILIKIHCENRAGMLVRALSEIEKLHLSVVNMSAMQFAAASLDITVITQIEEEFAMTTKELVKKLSSAIAYSV